MRNADLKLNLQAAAVHPGQQHWSAHIFDCIPASIRPKRKQMTAQETFNADENDGRHEDLKIISQWVRKELFVKVKFLYDVEEDLAVNGNIYNHFLRDCKQRLVGLRLNADRPSDYRRKYVESLWNQATRKKRNLISDGLNARRSSIYSATQNRFIGK